MQFCFYFLTVTALLELIQDENRDELTGNKFKSLEIDVFGY